MPRLICQMCLNRIDANERHNICSLCRLNFHLNHFCVNHGAEHATPVNPPGRRRQSSSPEPARSATRVCAACYVAIRDDEQYQTCPVCGVGLHLDHSCPQHSRAASRLATDAARPKIHEERRREASSSRPARVHVSPPVPVTSVEPAAHFPRSMGGQSRSSQTRAGVRRTPPAPRPAARRAQSRGPLLLVVVCCAVILTLALIYLLSGKTNPVGLPLNNRNAPKSADTRPSPRNTNGSPVVPRDPTASQTSISNSEAARPGKDAGQPKGGAISDGRESGSTGSTAGVVTAQTAEQRIPVLGLGNIQICSAASGWGSCRPQSAFKPGAGFCVYAEALDVAHQAGQDVLFRFDVRYSGRASVIAPRFTPGTRAPGNNAYAVLCETVGENWQPGDYSVQVQIADRISGAQKSASVGFAVQPIQIAKADGPISPSGSAPPHSTQGDGIIAWEGFLSGETEITFDEGRVNVGRATGSLPGVRCRVGITSKSNIDSLSFSEGLGVTSFSRMVIRVKPKKSDQPVRFMLTWRIQ